MNQKPIVVTEGHYDAVLGGVERDSVSTEQSVEPRTHDYGLRGWGHDYTWDPRNGGLEGTAIGWGRGLREGDYILLQSQSANSRDGRTRYQIASISYYRDPTDMWRAELRFAPRHT